MGKQQFETIKHVNANAQLDANLKYGVGTLRIEATKWNTESYLTIKAPEGQRFMVWIKNGGLVQIVPMRGVKTVEVQRFLQDAPAKITRSVVGQRKGAV